MKASEILRAAIPLIGTGDYFDNQPIRVSTLCHAVTVAARDAGDQAAKNTAQRVKDEIMRRLHPHMSLGSWLRRKHDVPKEKLWHDGYASTEALTNHRKQWAELLAQEFEAQGD